MCQQTRSFCVLAPSLKSLKILLFLAAREKKNFFVSSLTEKKQNIKKKKKKNKQSNYPFHKNAKWIANHNFVLAHVSLARQSEGNKYAINTRC